MNVWYRPSANNRIETALAPFHRARRQSAAVHLGVWGAIVGAGLATVYLIVVNLVGLIDDGLVVSAAGVVVLGVIVGLIAGWLRPVALPDLALDVDRHGGLRERATTALELARQPSLDALAERQIADAISHLQVVSPRLAFPIRLRRSQQIGLAVGVVLFAGAIAYSHLGPASIGSSSTTAMAAKAEATQLETLAGQIEKRPNSNGTAVNSALADQLQRAASAVRRDASNPAQLAADLAAAESLSAALAPSTGEDASTTMARIADAFAQQTLTKSVASALDRQDTAAAAQGLDDLASQLGAMTPSQRQALATALQQAAQAASRSDTNMSQQLQQAAQGAARGQGQSLQQAAKSLNQLGSAAQTQRAVAETEQALQNAQTAIAQSGLNASQNSTQNSGASQQAQANGRANTGLGQAGLSGHSGQANRSGQAGQNGQEENGQSQGSQSGSGIGTGTTNSSGSSARLQGLAQHDVTVPSADFAPSGFSSSAQTHKPVVGQAHVDYQNVLPTYQKRALAALNRGSMPGSYRDLVKGYFDSLSAHP